MQGVKSQLLSPAPILAPDAIRRADGFLDDFVRARSAVLARELFDSNDSLTRARQLSRLANFNLPAGFGAGLAQRIAQLEPQEVLALARRDLDPSREVLVCAGARPALERALAATGRPWRFVALEQVPTARAAEP